MNENNGLNIPTDEILTPNPNDTITVPATTETNEVIAKKENDNLDLASLNPVDQNKIISFLPKIDITDSVSITHFGATAQNKIASFHDETIRNIRTNQLGDTGTLLIDLVLEIKGFGKDAEKKGLFYNQKKHIKKLTVEYDKVAGNIDTIVSSLESHKMQLLKDVSLLDQMYKTNEDYFKEVTLYIIAGREKLKEVKNIILPELEAKANQTKDQGDIQKYQDMVNFTNRFEKKLHDLMITRTISIQTAPQIRIQQNNNTQIADKIHSSIVHTIPLWKGQVLMSLTLNNSTSALKTQQKVTDITNEMLAKNSEQLKQNSIEIARESERAIVDIDTLQKTNQNLIDTINEVISIQREGAAKRAQAQEQLQQMENQLRETIVPILKQAGSTPQISSTANDMSNDLFIG